MRFFDAGIKMAQSVAVIGDRQVSPVELCLIYLNSLPMFLQFIVRRRDHSPENLLPALDLFWDRFQVEFHRLLDKPPKYFTSTLNDVAIRQIADSVVLTGRLLSRYAAGAEGTPPAEHDCMYIGETSLWAAKGGIMRIEMIEDPHHVELGEFFNQLAAESQEKRSRKPE